MPRGSISMALLTLLIAAGTATEVIPAQAGSTGNGTVQPAHYSYCFGGNRGRGVVYFSEVIAPAAANPGLNVSFDRYVAQSYGPVANTGSTCIAAKAMADAVNDKKKREADFVSKTWKIVETKWAGADAP